MPLFDFKCVHNHVTEHLCRGRYIEAIKCPICDEAALRVGINVTGTPIFKGAGWYKPSRS